MFTTQNTTPEFMNSETERIFWFSVIKECLAEPALAASIEICVNEIPCFWIEEFLRYHPDTLDALRTRLQHNQLSASDWYVQPGMFFPSPEILIRNRLLSAVCCYRLLAKAKPIIFTKLTDQFDNAIQSSGYYSARAPLKKQGIFCFNRLVRYAEPLNCLARINGFPSNKDGLFRAWQLFLQNQKLSIQSVNCSDSLAEDAAFRHKQVADICDAIESRTLSRLFPEESGEPASIFVFNPGFWQRSSLVAYQFNRVNANHVLADDFQIIDTISELPIAHQILRENETPSSPAENTMHLLLDVPDIPPLNFKRLRIIKKRPTDDSATPLKSGRFFLENAFLRVTVLENGSLTLYDKLRQQQYGRMNVFEACTDLGDTAEFVSSGSGKPTLSKSVRPRISLIESGPLRGIIRIRYRMKISTNSGRKKSSQEVLRIWSQVSLDHNAPFLRIKTRIKNTIINHRLRARLETGINTNTSFTRQLDRIAERTHRGNDRVAFSGDYEFPMQGFVTVKDSRRALTIFSDDMMAYQLHQDSKRTLTLTALRSIGTLHNEAEFSPDFRETASGQCQSDHVFEYAIFPHTPDENRWYEAVNSELEQFAAPAIAWHANTGSSVSQPAGGLSFTSRELVLLCFKEAETGDALIARILNPTEREISSRGTVNFQCGSISIISCDESTGRKALNVRNGAFDFMILPQEIITFEITGVLTFRSRK
ncbi:hypothetical protein JXJ21_20365 [candidate division KSB1 bacterium]|nr:hypothetical protein [candidate division KSB1 bacterium]